MRTTAMKRHILGLDRQGTPIGVCHVRPVPEPVMCKGYRKPCPHQTVCLFNP